MITCGSACRAVPRPGVVEPWTRPVMRGRSAGGWDIVAGVQSRGSSMPFRSAVIWIQGLLPADRPRYRQSRDHLVVGHLGGRPASRSRRRACSQRGRRVHRSRAAAGEDLPGRDRTPGVVSPAPALRRPRGRGAHARSRASAPAADRANRSSAATRPAVMRRQDPSVTLSHAQRPGRARTPTQDHFG